MKGRFANLSINAYGSRFDLATRKEKEDTFAMCKNFVPADATAEELRIVQYLDESKIFMMDVKTVLADKANKECLSPILAA